ncbi:hypothetical protein ACFQJD_06105 [Haloplanus sp. GCM10025708]|uniref:hypothetical protein n=1 Tax=Haloferacaceae TaxID=1644056 RepID=UPI003622E84D
MHQPVAPSGPTRTDDSRCRALPLNDVGLVLYDPTDETNQSWLSSRDPISLPEWT